MKYILLPLALLTPFFVHAETSLEKGQALFESRCHMCHQPPKAGSLTVGQWKAVLKTMQIRMKQAGMEPLSKDETTDLHQFLEVNAR